MINSLKKAWRWLATDEVGESVDETISRGEPISKKRINEIASEALAKVNAEYAEQDKQMLDKYRLHQSSNFAKEQSIRDLENKYSLIAKPMTEDWSERKSTADLNYGLILEPTLEALSKGKKIVFRCYPFDEGWEGKAMEIDSSSFISNGMIYYLTGERRDATFYSYECDECSGIGSGLFFDSSKHEGSAGISSLIYKHKECAKCQGRGWVRELI